MKTKIKIDFIGIGAEKSATGWIFECLKDHPEICGSIPKEINFFNYDYNYKRGLKFYFKHFSHCSQNKKLGEYSPKYLTSQKAAKRIYKSFPKVKLILCLRNPIKMLYSLYNFQVKTNERLSIYKSFDDAIYKDQFFCKRGFHFRHLSKFLQIFPQNNILVLIYENLKKDSYQTIKKIYKFLDLKNIDFIPPTLNKKVNVTGFVNISPKIPLINSLYFKFGTFVKQLIHKSGGMSFLRNSIIIKLRFLLLKVIDFNRKEIYRKMVIEDKKEFRKNNFTLNHNLKKYLNDLYKNDIINLEKLLGFDLDIWKYY